MYHLQLTLETPAMNLALDEALLDAATEGELPGEALRVWEPDGYFVVLGRSSAPEREVWLEACRADGVPLLRRCSGGATVVAGPGCLMYAVVLDRRRRDGLRGIDQAHRFVLERLRSAIDPFAQDVQRSGTSDLTLPNRSGPAAPRLKFSGNSLRIKRDHLLYHGTILYDFPLQRIGRWLSAPVRQPAYRASREHGQFLANLGIARKPLIAALMTAWDAAQPLPTWPEERTKDLAETRYPQVSAPNF